MRVKTLSDILKIKPKSTDVWRRWMKIYGDKGPEQKNDRNFYFRTGSEGWEFIKDKKLFQ